MTAMSTTSRRGAPGWLIAMAASSAAVVMLPSTAIAADAGASTVRARLDSVGGVKDIKVYGPDGAAGTFSGNLPIKMSATRTVSGGSTVLSYHVENTMSQKQDVSFTDTAGKTYTSPVELQLPLVAQLGVTLPKSMKDVAAPGASISTDPDGTRHVLWQMVLFTPLGAASQDVSLTASGDGKPSVQLRATVVDPTNAAGISSAGQAANQSITQDDFWKGYASGGNEGLTKLRDGMGQLVAGLQLLAPGANKLASGLGAAGDGANKLAAGTDKAKDGAGQLSAGLVKIQAGQAALTSGLKLIHDGQAALTGGLVQLHDGAGALTTGIGKIHDGQGTLTTGLGQLSGGIDQLAAGLPGALSGVSQLADGVTKLLAGVGDTTTPDTLIKGVNDLYVGASTLLTSLAPGGQIDQVLGCSADFLGILAYGNPGTTADPCLGGATPVATGPTTDPVLQPTSRAMLTNLLAVRASLTTTSGDLLHPSFHDGLTAIVGGLGLVRSGLDHTPTSSTDKPGVKQGLQMVAGGLSALYSGLSAAQVGAGQLATGAKSAVIGSQQLTDGSGAALIGSQQLTDGSGAALTGAQQLADGSGKAAVGAKALYAGAGKALTGSKQLTAGSASALTGSTQLLAGAGQAVKGSQALVLGLGQLSVGQHQVADGLPAAVSGAAQIAGGLAQVLTGATAVKDGLGQVQDGAVGPLNKQLGEASQNARKQVAILAAAGALAAKAPGGAGASYVLDQAGFNPKLSASTSSLNSDSHTGRNLGIGVGVLALLLFGIAGGFAAGRRQGVTAP